MLDPTLTIEERITELIQDEVDRADRSTAAARSNLEAFCLALVAPFESTITFSGGVTRRCWTITRADGDYRVVYMPLAGYFALCVEGENGPMDVGVYGPALGCFCSV